MSLAGCQPNGRSECPGDDGYNDGVDVDCDKNGSMNAPSSGVWGNVDDELLERIEVVPECDHGTFSKDPPIEVCNGKSASRRSA